VCDAAEGAAIVRLGAAPVMQLWEVPPPTGSAEGAKKGGALFVLVLGVSDHPQGRRAMSQFRGRMARSMATRSGIELST
jgi:hypothetical protein